MTIQNRGTVTVAHQGKTYMATWHVEKGVITVSTASGRKSTQLGDSPPESLARMMLREAINAGELD